MRDGKIEPRDKRFIVVRLQGHLPCPTPLPEHQNREFSSLCQQAPLWWRKPYTPIYTPQLRHNFYTTYSHYSTSHQFFFTSFYFTPIYFTPIFFTPIFFTPIFFTTLLISHYFYSQLLFTTSTPRSI